MFLKNIFLDIKAQLAAKKLISEEKYSCRRQQLELFCENGTQQTQFVMRWYLKEENCIAYLWGYCPGLIILS